MKFLVTKKFVSGVLEGLEYVGVTTVEFTVGKLYKACAGSSDYIVTECRRIG